MQQGKLSRKKFMAEIVEMTEHIVSQAKFPEHDTIPGDFGAIRAVSGIAVARCTRIHKKFQCQACDFAFWKIIAGRQLESHETDELLTKREIGPLRRIQTGWAERLRPNSS